MSEDEIVIEIEKKRFRFWKNLSLNLTLDSIDNLTLTTVIDHQDTDFKRFFTPASFKEARVLVGEEEILRGYLINRSASLNYKELSFSIVSLPAVLNDLSVPPDRYPLEFKSQSLFAIAQQLASFYDIPVRFSAPAGPVFDPPVGLEPDEKILEFLIKLAQKRNLLVSNNRFGELKFFQPGSSQNSSPLRQGEIPLLDAELEIDEQQLYSSVTGFSSAEAARDPQKFTKKIKALAHLNRNFSYLVSESQGAELQQAVNFKASRLLAGAIKIRAVVASLRGKSGKLWWPGDFISLYTPGIFFYNETKLMIRNVNFSQSERNKNINLDLVFPELYLEKILEKLPWQS